MRYADIMQRFGKSFVDVHCFSGRVWPFKWHFCERRTGDELPGSFIYNKGFVGNRILSDFGQGGGVALIRVSPPFWLQGCSYMNEVPEMDEVDTIKQSFTHKAP